MKYGTGGVFITLVKGFNLPAYLPEDKWVEYEIVIHSKLNKKRNNTIVEMQTAFLSNYT
jgi:hypothetical protein